MRDDLAAFGWNEHEFGVLEVSSMLIEIHYSVSLLHSGADS